MGGEHLYERYPLLNRVYKVRTMRLCTFVGFRPASGGSRPVRA
jgi:hypothetical protein